jgi:hypothetical protein
MPEKLILSKDVRFVVRSDGGRLGTLKISQGSIDWRPARRRGGGPNEISVGWEQFRDLMELKTGISSRANRINREARIANYGPKS